MNSKSLAALMWVCGAATVSPVQAQQPAAVFPFSSVEHVDVRNQVLTFKTEDGQLRMFRVAETVAIRREWLGKGDLVRIEVDLDDQIVNIVKVDRRPEPAQQLSRRK